MWSRVSRKSGGFHQRADPRPRQRLSAAVVQVCVPSPPGNNNSWELHIAGPLCWFFFFLPPWVARKLCRRRHPTVSCAAAGMQMFLCVGEETTRGGMIPSKK